MGEAMGVASLITPVPGGVGPMTIAMLLKNTVNLARHSLNMSRLPLRMDGKQVTPHLESTGVPIRRAPKDTTPVSIAVVAGLVLATSAIIFSRNYRIQRI